ncbi:hypothetical protein [Dinghuibacter silviterrae]|uniref:Uncharacterized protein n=1 Tax=Dinghuibacter silviterrae TaxID=1539049 RepID=A0A4R8DU38_9BACT|nr:hypothetical protein [Dinghuibacter silviterrae]TDX01864.1 hypothetical protein EDB95_2908 [Dinghuibacter silviterrae]
MPAVKTTTGGIQMLKAYDHAIMGNYCKKKYLAFSQLTGFAQPAFWFISKTNFQNLMTSVSTGGGFRVYFGYCDPANCPASLKAYAGSLVLVFSATDFNYKDLALTTPGLSYYVVTPPTVTGGGPFTGGPVVTVPHADASNLVANFQNTIVPFSAALNTAVQTAYKNTPVPAFSETTSLWYIKGWADAVNSDITTYNVQGISFFIGAYSNDDGDDGQPPTALQQTTLVAEYASSFAYEGNTYYFHFDPEDIVGGQPAPPASAHGRAPQVISHFFGDNTANPCPPNTCGGVSLP